MGHQASAAKLTCLACASECAECDDGTAKSSRSDGQLPPLYDSLPIFEDPCLRVLICDLEEELARSKRRIPAGEFSEIWRQCALTRAGKLTELELQIIKATSKVFLEMAPTDKMGTVDPFVLAAYVLSEPEPASVKALRARLRAISLKSFDQLQAVFRLFSNYDLDTGGMVTSTELGCCLMEMARIMGLREAVMMDAITETVRLADFDFDGKTDLWEALSLLLGRRATPVEILLYDLSGGASDNFSEFLLGQHFEAIYHSSVLAFGAEHWYGGNLYKAPPPQYHQFGRPLSTSVTELKPSAYQPDLRVVHVGFTLATYGEFKLWLSETAERFQPEHYDVVNWNCNCFSDEAAQFLTGKTIPDSVRQMPKLMMSTIQEIPILRPLLNKWLGGQETGLNPETAKVVESLKLPECVEIVETMQVTTLVDENGRFISTI